MVVPVVVDPDVRLRVRVLPLVVEPVPVRSLVPVVVGDVVEPVPIVVPVPVVEPVPIVVPVPVVEPVPMVVPVPVVPTGGFVPV